MLTLLNLAQLVLYIALLSLAGQGLLYLLAGASRERNLFYRVLQAVGRPATALLRVVAPRGLSDAQVGWLAFALVVALYAVVTVAKVDWCLRGGLLGQAGCR